MTRPDRTPAWRWMRLHPRAWMGLGLLAHLIVAAVCAATPTVHLGDFHRYWGIATGPGRVYVDVPVEYPPGAILAFRGLARLAGNQHAFNALLLLVNVIADLAVVGVLLAVWGMSAAAVYLWVSLPILSLLVFRFDLWPILAVTAAVGLLARQRPKTGVLLLCAGAAVKLWPLPFIALWMKDEWRPWRVPAAWCFAVLTAAGVAAWWFWGGWHGVLGVLTFRGATGWDIESTVGGLWRPLDPASLRLESGAMRVGHNVPVLSIVLFAVSMPISMWALWRGTQQPGAIGAGWVTGLGVVLACSALLSPQFLGWLLPGAAIAWAEGDRRTTRVVAGLIVLTVVYRILHTQQMPGLVLLRNIALVAAVVQALRTLATAQPVEDQLVFRFEPEAPPHSQVGEQVHPARAEFRRNAVD